jgi:hypothetical protein
MYDVFQAVVVIYQKITQNGQQNLMHGLCTGDVSCILYSYLQPDCYSVLVKCKKYSWQALPIIFQLCDKYYDNLKASNDYKEWHNLINREGNFETMKSAFAQNDTEEF